MHRILVTKKLANLVFTQVGIFCRKEMWKTVGIKLKNINVQSISVVGGGLAGTECALQLVQMGYQVELYEMRKVKLTPAHKTTSLAEIVCSNSFGSLGEGSAPQQLKWEAEKLGSYLLKAAHESRVPAGQALAVDREIFSNLVTKWVRENPNIRVHDELVTSLDSIPRPCVIATGPLTDESLASDLQKHFGNEFCYFFDAIAPIIDADSIDHEIVWAADRYDKGPPDYLNCPLDKEQYYRLIDEIKLARKIEPKHFESTQFFEGCMPIEVMVDRGPRTLSFGPMKPVGLINPRTGREPYAAVQLRKENKEGTSYNMVGFQTRMAYPEQTRVFRMIPGLENAEFLKLGSIHRNLFINSPSMLNRDLSSKKDPWLFFAGQITGVEGYFESITIGLLVARFLDQKLKHHSQNLSRDENTQFAREQIQLADGSANSTSSLPNLPPRASALGSLIEAITDPTRAKHFQPTNINFGLLPPLPEEIHDALPGKRKKDKAAKKLAQIEQARKSFLNWI